VDRSRGDPRAAAQRRIESPALTSTDPFPMREPPEGMHGVEILVLASQADDARRIMAHCLASASPDESPEESREEKSGE